MNRKAIVVENMSKRFWIAEARQRNDTLCDQLSASMKLLFHRRGNAGRYLL
jgi:hypothetical protein